MGSLQLNEGQLALITHYRRRQVEEKRRRQQLSKVPRAAGQSSTPVREHQQSIYDYQKLYKSKTKIKREKYGEMDIKRYSTFGEYDEEKDKKPSFEEYCKDRAEYYEKYLNREFEKSGKNSFGKLFEKFSGYAAFFFVFFYGAMFISTIILLNSGKIKSSHYLRCNLTLSFFMFLYGIVLAILRMSSNLHQLQGMTGTFFLLLFFIGIIVAVGPTVQKLKTSFSQSSQYPSSNNPTEPKYPMYLTIGFYIGFFIACAYFIPVFLIWLVGPNCLLATNGVSYSVCKCLHS
jgi:hypothetical protein